MSLLDNDIYKRANEAMLESIEDMQAPSVASAKVAKPSGKYSIDAQFERNYKFARNLAIEPFTRRNPLTSGQTPNPALDAEFKRILPYLKHDNTARAFFSKWWSEARRTMRRPLLVKMPVSPNLTPDDL